jgi:hypothetical protein
MRLTLNLSLTGTIDVEDPSGPVELNGDVEMAGLEGWTLGAGWTHTGNSFENSGTTNYLSREAEEAITDGLTVDWEISYENTNGALLGVFLGGTGVSQRIAAVSSATSGEPRIESGQATITSPTDSIIRLRDIGGDGGLIVQRLSITRPA